MISIISTLGLKQVKIKPLYLITESYEGGNFYSNFLNGIPIVILFFLVFTGFDLSIATVEFVSFNFVYIILFFYVFITSNIFCRFLRFFRFKNNSTIIKINFSF